MHLLFRTCIWKSHNLLIEKSGYWEFKVREPGQSVSETNSGVRSTVEDWYTKETDVILCGLNWGPSQLKIRNEDPGISIMD